MHSVGDRSWRTVGLYREKCRAQPVPGFKSSTANSIIPNGDLVMGAGAVDIRSGGPPRPAQRLPANQRASEREERLVDVGPLVLPHTQTAKLSEPGKRPLHDPPPPAQ